jgi:hypothetical protein
LDSHQTGNAIVSRPNGFLYSDDTITCWIVTFSGPLGGDNSVAIIAPHGSELTTKVACLVAALRRSNPDCVIFLCHLTSDQSDELVRHDFETMVAHEISADGTDALELPSSLSRAVEVFLDANLDAKGIAAKRTHTVILRNVSPFWFWRSGKRVPSYLMPRYT